MTRDRTERAKYHFKVSEHGDGTCFISTETLGADVPVLEQAHAHLGFDLAKGIPLQKAGEIADFLNHNLVNVTYTIAVDEFQKGMIPLDLKPR